MAVRKPRFSPGLSQSELIAGYKKVGSRSPIKKADVNKALKSYGIKPGDKRRLHASDRALAKVAARAVVRKHRAAKKKK